ncbi:MAG: 50S ribosomal protein L4 [Chloroflexi bacterium]|nr:50S ribosomal protein L4 [Chloroflexota bacterium]MBP8058660.1 50S ribosomal protein L4 [Chloroflexota bacterium]
MEVSVLNTSGQEVGRIELPASIFSAKVNRGLMHQALVYQLVNARRGTHKTKTRAEVSRTTAKVYKQKGTGNARHGSKKAPIFVGGGIAHGPQPRDYVKRMPRKMRRAALRSALSVKAGDGNIVVLDDLQLSVPKTKDMVGIVARLVGTESALVLLPGQNVNVELSARNLPHVKALRAHYLNMRDLLGHEKLVLPLSALDVLKSFLEVEEDAAASEGEEA